MIGTSERESVGVKGSEKKPNMMWVEFKLEIVMGCFVCIWG